MSIVWPVLDSAGKKLYGLFQKVNTPADKFRYQTNLPGRRLVLSSLAAGEQTFDLGTQFQYQVKKNQLNVYSIDPTTWECKKLLDKDLLWAAPTTQVYYEEINSHVIKIYNVPNIGSKFLVEVPHTASPGLFTSKVIVSPQGDKIFIESQGAGDKILWVTPNGNRYLLGMDDDGNLNRERI